jgi:hypothetical protein
MHIPPEIVDVAKVLVAAYRYSSIYQRVSYKFHPALHPSHNPANDGANYR